MELLIIGTAAEGWTAFGNSPMGIAIGVGFALFAFFWGISKVQ
jgi:hypothetical protein